MEAFRISRPKAGCGKSAVTATLAVRTAPEGGKSYPSQVEQLARRLGKERSSKERLSVG
jgi:hypothetical protein